MKHQSAKKKKRENCRKDQNHQTISCSFSSWINILLISVMVQSDHMTRGSFLLLFASHTSSRMFTKASTGGQTSASPSPPTSFFACHNTALCSDWPVSVVAMETRRDAERRIRRRAEMSLKSRTDARRRVTLRSTECE